MLRQRRRRRMVWRRPEHREDQRDAAAHGFRAVQLRLAAEEELLLPRRVLPAYDGGPVEEYLDRFAGGQHGRDARVRVRDVDLCLRRQAGRDGIQSRGLLWAVHHVWDLGVGLRECEDGYE